MVLQLHISTGSPTPIYRQIVDQVRHAVAARALKTGDRLPSVRALAEQLVINPNTAAKAYGELARDGLIAARQGRGYFVADRRQIYSKAERLRRLEQALETFLSEALVLDFTHHEITQALGKKLTHFQTGKDTRRGQTDG